MQIRNWIALQESYARFADIDCICNWSGAVHLQSICNRIGYVAFAERKMLIQRLFFGMLRFWFVVRILLSFSLILFLDQTMSVAFILKFSLVVWA